MAFTEYRIVSIVSTALPHPNCLAEKALDAKRQGSMTTEAADAFSSDDDDAVGVTVESDIKLDDREIVRCVVDTELIAAAESITNSFLAAEPEPVQVAESSLKRKRAKQRQCGCALGEACHICSKCFEKHCTCGDRKRHRSLCLESRACSCLLVDPADRCTLCLGCQRKQGYSHCRCIQHGQQRLQGSRATLKNRAANKGEKSDGNGVQCRCFAMAADAIPPAANGSVSERSLRIRRLRRAVGIPSVESLYHRAIGASLTDDEDAEGVGERDATNGGGIVASSEEGLRSVLHHPLTRRMMSAETYAPPYQQLHLRDGASLLESIEPKDGIARAHPIAKGLVDYLVHASSVKAGNVGEMVGTFDDSAAVAAAIVVEEYMKQIVGDLLGETSPVFPLTKTSVQAFASHMLKGFNWTLFCQRHSGVVDAIKWKELASAIYHELVAVEMLEEEVVSEAKKVELLGWIRETVARHCDFLQLDAKRRPATEDDKNSQEKQTEASEEDILESLRSAASEVPTPHVRVGVRRNESLGLPVYNFTLRSKLAGDHLIRVSGDNFENQQKALSKVDDVKKVLADQHRRIWNDIVEDMPAMLQRELAAELEFPTGREIMKLPPKVQKYFDMKNKIRRKKEEERMALFMDPKVVAEMQAEKARKHAAKVQRLEARKAETERRNAEKKRLAAEKRQAIKEQRMAKQKPRKWTKMEELDEFNDPATDALYQQLRDQIRQAVGSPSSRPAADENSRPPRVTKPRPRPVRPKPPADPSAPRRPRGRPRKVIPSQAPSEDTNALTD